MEGLGNSTILIKKGFKVFFIFKFYKYNHFQNNNFNNKKKQRGKITGKFDEK